MIHPSLNKRYKTNDKQLRYLRLPVTLLTDTIYSKIISRQGNKAAEKYFVMVLAGEELSQ
jgi:hypothetical protein